MKFLLIFLVVGTLLAACSDKPPEPIAAPATPAARVATPFDAMRADEQRARDVQKTIDQNAEKQRKQIDAAAQ